MLSPIGDMKHRTRWIGTLARVFRITQHAGVTSLFDARRSGYKMYNSVMIALFSFPSPKGMIHASLDQMSIAPAHGGSVAHLVLARYLA